jgi:hypothetical protein
LTSNLKIDRSTSMPRKATKRDRPAGLGEDGGRLWDAITGEYQLRPDELQLLVDAAREVDLIDRMQAELTSAALVVKGSYGQPAPNPLLTEVRQHRATLGGLLRQLKLPDSPAGLARKAGHVTEQARAAANARWGRNGA